MLLVMRVVIPAIVLLLLVRRFGADGFRPALAVITPISLLAALALGLVAATAQASRWRLMMHGAGLPLQHREALAECYRAGALNTVLPGGVAGDVLRAWRQRTDAPQGWRPAAACVLADRAVGLCVLLSIAAAILLIEAPPLIAVAVVAVAAVAWAVSRPGVRPLALPQQAAVWGWSVIMLAALLGMASLVGVAVGVGDDPGALATLGVAVLAGMAVPFNLGGWGPREAAGALAATLVGVSPSVGMSVAVGYGLLSAVSVLPGFLVLVTSGLVGLRDHSRRREVELHTYVVPENEVA
jgi:uncharacterized membrane protein YbhN (UPF0104 family)